MQSCNPKGNFLLKSFGAGGEELWDDPGGPGPCCFLNNQSGNGAATHCGIKA